MRAIGIVRYGRRSQKVLVGALMVMSRNQSKTAMMFLYLDHMNAARMSLIEPPQEYQGFILGQMWFIGSHNPGGPALRAGNGATGSISGNTSG